MEPVSELFFKLLLISLFYIWLHWVLVASRGLSLVSASRGYSLVAVHGLRAAGAAHVEEHRL